MIDNRLMTLLEEEAEDTLCLFRKRLDILNDIPAEDLDEEDVDEIHHIYETLHHMMDLWRGMPVK